MKYFDAHTHIQFPVFDADRSDVLARMREEEVGGLIVGCDLASSKAATALVENEHELFASIGLHPNHAHEEEFDSETYRELAKHPKVVAIGECGLDEYRPEDPNATREKQRETFTKHVELAIESDKPLMVHARPAKGSMNAYNDALDIIESYQKEHGEKLRGDFHFFVGDVETARRAFSAGFTVSYTAVLTFTHDYDDVVRFAPLERLLSETDAPYVAPASRRGTRNDPLATIDVVDAIAHIRGEETGVVREALLANSRKLFNI